MNKTLKDLTIAAVTQAVVLEYKQTLKHFLNTVLMCLSALTAIATNGFLTNNWSHGVTTIDIPVIEASHFENKFASDHIKLRTMKKPGFVYRKRKRNYHQSLPKL